MRGDFRASTKYTDWALVPSHWIERRPLISTTLRNPGYILLHFVAGPPLAAIVGITIGVSLELVRVPDESGIWTFVSGALLVASLMGIRLLSFTVFNAPGVHILRLTGYWRWHKDIPWTAFRETVCVDLQEAPYDIHGFTPPGTHNLALYLTTMEGWVRFAGAGAVQGDHPDPLAGLPPKDRTALVKAFGKQGTFWRLDRTSTITPGFVRLSRPDDRRQEVQERIARDWRVLIEQAEQKRYLPRRFYPFKSYPGFPPQQPGSCASGCRRLEPEPSQRRSTRSTAARSTR